MRILNVMLFVVLVATSAPAQEPEVPVAAGAASGWHVDDLPRVRDAYRAVADRAGVEVTFDPRFTDDSIRVPDLEGLTFEAALRRIGTTAGTFAVLQSDGSIFVANDTPQNRREFEPIEIRSFPVRYRQVSEIEKALRSLIEARRLNTDVGGGTVTMRDTAVKLCLAEQILEVLDRPPAEIDIAVAVVELPASELPLCDGAPCTRVDGGTVSRTGVYRWHTTVSTVGSRDTTHTVDVALANGERLIASLQLTARHLPALDTVELHVKLECGVVVDSHTGARKLGTKIGSTVRLAGGEACMIRAARPESDPAVVVLLEPIVRRPDPWGGMDPLHIAVGTEARLTAQCGPPAMIP